jgi:hypothetical protein
MVTKKIFQLIIFILTLFTISICAQENGTIRGVVKDSTTLESLPFGNVYIKELNIGAPTNNRGYFVLRSLQSNKQYTIVVSYVGYRTKKISVYVDPDKVSDIEILLIPSRIQMKDIEKVEFITKEANLPDLGKTVLTPKELEMIPKSVETDVLRSLTSLPGVQSSGDVSAKFNVRGGETNQNLILIDGIPVYYPFHAIGLFSVIDPGVISSVEFFRGGFPSKYGRAVSSVLNLITREGDKNKFDLKLGASLLSAKGVIEGPIPDGSFYITARKSLSNGILKKFVNNDDLPIDFYDASFKINFANPHFFSGSKFTLQSLMSGDNLKYSDATRPDYKWTNNNWGLKIFSVGDIPLFLDFGITLSRFTNEIIAKQSGIKPKMNEVSDFTISTDFLYVLGNKDEISFGADIKSITSKLFLLTNLDFRTDVGSDGLSSNAYVNYKFLNISNFGIDFGTRFNLKEIAVRGIFVEPRVNISYLLAPWLTLKTAYGIYQQEITTIVDEREVLSLFDPVIIVPAYLPKSKSTHYVFGASSKVSENLSIEIEGYYKKIDSAPTLNETKASFSEPDLLPSTGESYGGELLTKYRTDVVELSCAYTLSWAFKKVNGIKYSPRYDSRHNLNFSATMNLPDDWQFTASWVYHSGFPFTQQGGYYDKLSLDNFFNDFRIYELLTPITYFNDKNIARLPDYHRLDLIVAKKLKLNFIKLDMDISAVNVYNRKNLYYFEQNTGKRVNMLPFLLTATVKVEI